MMKNFAIATTLAACAAMASPAVADHHAMEEEAAPDEMAALEVLVWNTAGEEVGTISLEQTPNGVLIAAEVSGIPEGWHGFHIHETGKCEPEEGFKTAGGHYAPRSHEHGIRIAAGPHAGDMPNQYAGADGMLRAHVLNDGITLGEGFNSLMDADGSALVIHAGADDYKSAPSGAAGSRLACAVISAPAE